MAISTIVGKVARWFGYIVFGVIALGLLVAVLGVFFALIGAYVIS
jgi:hypothetical protein